MAHLDTFTPEVAESIFQFTKENPKFPGKGIPESVWDFGFSVWDFGFAKGAPGQLSSVSKMYLSCQHVATGENICFGFTVTPGSHPLQFKVAYWTRRGDERVGTEFIDTEEAASAQDAPAVIRHAARKSYELAYALRLERQGEARERREGAR